MARQSNAVIPGIESFSTASTQCTTTEHWGSVDFSVVSEIGKENSAA
jgi:hypothetical protein